MTLVDADKPFEQLLTELSDDALDRQERQYEIEAVRINILLTAVRAAKEARRVLRGEEASDNGRRPSMTEALLTVMNHDAKRHWTTDELLLRISQVGAPPGGKTPKNSVAAALSKMVEERLVVRVGRGLYALPMAAPVRSSLDELGWAPSSGEGET
jgi:hypothetical protein